MRWMNDDDIERSAHQHRHHQLLGLATRQLVILESWTNSHSDGWCYWPKPARAAARLMELIQGVPFERCPNCYRVGSHEYMCDRPDVTKAALIKALAPIKAFRTRQGADFELVKVV